MSTATTDTAPRSLLAETPSGCTVYREKIGKDKTILAVYAPSGDRIPYQYEARISFEAPRSILINVLAGAQHSDTQCRYHKKDLIMPTKERIRCEAIRVIRDKPGYIDMIQCKISI